MPISNPAAELGPHEPIGCADYEYVELACMERYQVAVLTAEGSILGQAVDTRADASGEHLVLEDKAGVQRLVRVDLIEKLSVLSTPSHFDEWCFRGPLGPLRSR